MPRPPPPDLHTIMSQIPIDKVAEQELNQFIEQIQQQQQHTLSIQRKITQINDLCYTQCITNDNTDTLDSTQSSCVESCINMYINTSKQLQQQLTATLTGKQ